MEFLQYAAPAAAFAFVAGWFVAQNLVKQKVAVAEQQRHAADEEIAEARLKVATAKKDALLEAKEEQHKLRQELDQESRERRLELQKSERRVSQRDEQLDRRQQNVDKRDRNLQQRETQLKNTEDELEAIKLQQLQELERVAQLPIETAKEMLMARVEEEMGREVALRIRELEESARQEADQRARKVVTMAVQRCAVEATAESTVAVVPITSDEVKGRIIGREGRNIRTFEQLAGVDLIIDDTPEAVVVSCFDPVRRQIAKVALGNLVADGRIHPGRIEEVLNKARNEVGQRMREAAEKACLESKVSGLAGPVMDTLGKMLFRTSYGQNVLWHSVEVSVLAAMLAAEVGADVNVARRAGLLHDIGKGLDHQIEGTHVEIGVELLKRGRESAAVIHAVAAHHEDLVKPETVEAVLVIAADAISSSRPGARRDMFETYVQRLTQLEAIADSFKGVEKSFAVQAGREVRIIVKPEDIDDLMSVKLARDVAQRIETEMQYPGEIRVTIIRETRAVDFAR